MMATFARDFESDFEAKRARHERFVKDLTRTEGLRVEEAYLVEAMAMEEVKRRRAAERDGDARAAAAAATTTTTTAQQVNAT